MEDVVVVRWAQVSRSDTTPGDARAVLRHLVAEVAPGNGQVRVGRRCSVCGSTRHGRPVVTSARGHDLHVSLSRAPGLVAVAVTTQGPIGIDVEEVARTAFAGFADVALHPDESAESTDERGRVWTRKEAVLKAVGVGLHIDPRLLHVGGADAPPSVVGVLPAPADHFDASEVEIADLQLPQGFAGAVAVISPPPEGGRILPLTLTSTEVSITAVTAAPAASPGRASGGEGRPRPLR